MHIMKNKFYPKDRGDFHSAGLLAIARFATIVIPPLCIALNAIRRWTKIQRTKKRTSNHTRFHNRVKV